MIITDPWFYIVSIPAVLIYGIGKGGLGGALGVISVPLMAWTIPPTQAAAILLPILCVMDFFAVKHHRHFADVRVIKRMLPASALGVALAALYLGSMTESSVKLIVGLLSVLFFFMHLFQRKQPKPGGTFSAWFWSTLCGFSSTAIHAGGGPASLYLLPLRLEKTTLIATMAVLFAIINLFKLVPFTLLGTFDSTNLLTSLVLMPLAPIGVKIGVWLLDKVPQQTIYQLCYGFLLLSGTKLLLEGIS
ncbi:sulfite exporter TauE/SafE family protein [Vibrio natriegens]|uniref:sulfite exporter TauE/SafE family protein n=1 Tax=Vibrio natriegens TaxID=691 RepID=UPI003B59643D